MQINAAPLAYWQATRYRTSDVDDACNAANDRFMAARITFNRGLAEVTITKRTWDRQEGHFPTIAKFFGELAQHPLLARREGVLIAWLEDGLWESEQEFSARAPLLSFGRHVLDSCTFLMPDPAYLGASGYVQELKNMAARDAVVPWEAKKPIVFWRGAATGLGIETPDWVNTPRGRLALLAAKLGDPLVLDAKITKIAHLLPEQQRAIVQAGVFGDPCEFMDFLDYRFLVDADGYCCAWMSHLLKLGSGSLLLKVQSDYEQWYYRQLVPWHHFIPLKPDLRDYLRVRQWLTDHDDEARAIARRGEEFVRGLTFGGSCDELARSCAAILDCRIG